MRCAACNEILTDYEASVRSVFSREYVSLCKPKPTVRLKMALAATSLMMTTIWTSETTADGVARFLLILSILLYCANDANDLYL